MTERSSDAELLDPLFIDRWSPRSFTDTPVTDDQLAAIFEAARWAPSWMNNQPWRFVYETDGPDRQKILDVFMANNRDWAQHAPVVGLVIAKSEMEGFMARTVDFDTGSAMMSLILQASMFGLSAHLLGGIEVDAAHEMLGVGPEEAKVLCGFVIGHRGPADRLHEKLQAREHPSPRRPVSEFAFKGAHLPS
jgi:nitroreductase